MRPSTSLLFLALDTYAAIVPTTPGQIGINPVDLVETQSVWTAVNTEYLTKDPSSYIGPIGSNTDVLTDVSGSTQWIGVNTQYLTENYQTSTISGTPAVITNAVAISIVGPTATGGSPTADVDILMSPALLSDINALATQYCGAPGTRKRSGVACAVDFLAKASTTIEVWATAQKLEFGAGAYGGIMAAELARLIEDDQPVPNKVHIFFTDYTQATTTQKSTAFVITLAPPQTPAVTSPTPSSTTLSSSSASSPAAGTTISVGEPPDPTGACWLYTGTPAVYNDDTDTYEVDDPGDDLGTSMTRMRSRSLAGRIHLSAGHSPNPAHEIQKRGNNLISTLGLCTNELNPKVVRDPKFYRANQLMNSVSGLNPSQWWYIPIQSTNNGVSGSCDVATLQHVGKRNPANPGVGIDQFPVGYSGPSKTKTLSVDHVFELSLLQTFFASVFTSPTDERCQTIINLFNKKDLNPNAPITNGIPASRFQSLWNQGPNKQNNGFIGFDENVNGVKGKFFNAGLPDIQKIQTPASDPNWLDKNLNLWNDMGMAMAYLDIPVVANLYKIVNTAMYEALLAFNDIQLCEAPTEKTDWAATYKSWMPAFLSSQQASIQAYASALTAVVTNNPAATVDAENNPNLYATAFNGLKSMYNPASMTFDQGALLTWPVTATADIQKRAATSQCVITSASSTPTATPSCTAFGVPWYSPTSFCQCGASATYPTLSPTGSQTGANCAYTVLPTTQITPVATVPAPTNIPGEGGVPGCAPVLYPDGQACVNANYCNCGGTAVPFLTTTISGTSTTNCAYTIQPTANSCPPPTTTIAPPPPPTTTAPPPPPPTPTVGPITCNPLSETTGCSTSDVHANSVNATADYMQEQFDPTVPNTFTSASANFTRTYREGGAGGSGVTYMMSFGWIPGCSTYESQRPDRPIDPTVQFDWEGLLWSTYNDCNNEGLGGYVDVGCLRYGFFPNKVDGVFGTGGPADPELFWSTMHYC